MVPALTAMRVVPPGGNGPSPGPARLLPVRQARPVPVFPVLSRRLIRPKIRSWHPGPVRWPAAVTTTVRVRAGGRPGAALGAGALARPTPGSVRAGTLPLWIGPAGGTAARVQVTMAAHRLARIADMTGAIFRLSRADAGTAAAQVHVTLGYSGFADAHGGDYGSRLRLVMLPACALSTPRVAACRVQTPVRSANNAIRDDVGAVVSLPPASAGAGYSVILAATTSPSGSGGDYSATPLPAAGAWEAGGSSGAFTYSYPITVPPVPGGLVPQVSLGYNSQMADGLTSSTNSQASWIGDGWDYSPGFVERSYETCSQDKLSPSIPSGDKTGDLCWSTNNVTTLSLNGTNTTLVDDPANGWHAMTDNGAKISYVTGGNNGTKDGGYWKVTTPDGTSYYFGRNRLPGWISGDTTTNSAWTVPVYSPRSSDSDGCYNSTFSKSSCPQAWRWNLDYVVDSHGNAMAYFYNTNTNYYGADKATTGTASYVRSGHLSQIWYGFRDGSVYGGTNGAPAGDGEVVFTTAETRTDWPSDLACSSGASCNVNSPSFWTKTQLTTIDTYALEGSSMSHVDSWALSQSFPPPDTTTKYPPLWLDSITRTGEDGTAAPLPPVSFDPPLPLPNRVETQQDITDGYPAMYRNRIEYVTSETGAVTTASYDSPPASCTSGNFPSEDANTTVCYPDWWTPTGGAAFEDWFNKYVVTSVSQQNTAGGGPTIVTSYCYGAAPGCLSSGAWRYNDYALTKDSQRTWDQWRGFQQVTAQTGTSPDPVTEVVDRYYQGMDGDHLKSGGTASASLTSTVGNVTVTDKTQWDGLPFEHIVYDGVGGAMVSDKVTTPWTSGVTADQSQNGGLPDLKAYLTGVMETQTFAALAAGGSRESDVTYAHDTYGRVTSVSDVPDTNDSSQDTCTQTTYATNSDPSHWILDLPAEVLVTSVPPASCPISGTPTQAELVSDNLTFYDGATSLSTDVPTAGDVTQTQRATSFTTGPVYTTESTATYDEYGRILTSTNADGKTTTTAYTPTTGAEPTSVKVTDPANLATTTTYDPARDLPLTVTDPAGYVTTKQYDALGRLTAAWSPGHATTGPADDTFSYSLSANPPSGTAPAVVTTNEVTTAGGHTTTTDLFDSLGREVEKQTATPDGGRVITDKFYNSDGLVYLTSAPYYASGGPSAQLVEAAAANVPSQTGYVYDGAGRVTRQILYKNGAEDWETDTAYGGNYVTVTPPTGGTPQTTYTDGRGLTTDIYQYHSSPPPSSPPAPGTGTVSGPSGWDHAGYTYTTARQLAGITDAAGSQWSFGYDLAGDQVATTTPDTGTTTSTYDPAGRLLSVTDAAGNTVSYAYDNDGRRVGKYASTVSGQSASNELDSWLYDTLAPGQLTSSTSYTNGNVSGQPSYTQQVIGYNAFELPSAQETIVSSGPLAGTYRRNLGYTAYGDLPSSYFDYAAGGLPSETVSLSYDTSNRPAGLTSNLWTYVAALSYTEIGQPQEFALGTTSTPAWLFDSYYPDTGRLQTATVQSGTSAQTVDTTTYAYDQSGNVLSEADIPASGASQAQCFQYEYLARLSQAWAQGATPCASTPSQSAESGAAAGYWNAYTYNDQNDLTQEVSTPPSGSATTYVNSFPGTVTGSGTTLPHATGSQQASGPGVNTTTTFGYNADGQTTTISGSNGSQLTWGGTNRDPGQLTSIASGSSTTSYVYDASGNLLQQTDNGTTTLYLPDEQISSTSGTLSGTRYYTIGGVTIAARTSAGDVQYLFGDQQGTASLAIDAGTLAVTRRWFDPNGNQIGTPPPSWPGTRGFVGGTADTITGLTNLGAREYNPGIAGFISPDAILNPYDPQDLNPYAYASDNPATLSDPSGLCPDPGLCPPPNDQQKSLQQGENGQTTPLFPAGGPGQYTCGLYGCSVLPVIATPRIIVPHHATNGLGTCSNTVPGRDAGICTIDKSSGGGGNLYDNFISGWHVFDHWLNTPETLPNYRWVTGSFNIAYGYFKVNLGVTLLTAGTLEDATGIGALLGIPTDVYGAYQGISGIARVATGARQISQAYAQPTVVMTPKRYIAGAVVDALPLSGVIDYVIGW